MANPLDPIVSSELARDIYAVQEDFDLEIFLMKKYFTTAKGGIKKLDAEVGTRLIHTRDGFGVCALGKGDYEKHAFLMFRGSTTANYGADWANNFRIGVEISSTGQPVHLGFNSIFKSMREDIKKFLDSNNQEITFIHCLGHSLGGAIATLCSDWVSANYSTKTTRLYTFGAPKAGLEPFAKHITRKLEIQSGNKSIFRVFHTTDPVPMIPLYPFYHPPYNRHGFHISCTLPIGKEPHDMVLYAKDCKKRNAWENINDSLPPSSKEVFVEKWLKSEKSLNPFNPMTWEWIGAGLEYVIKKIVGASLSLFQTALSGVITLADKLAYILRVGIETSKELSFWVIRLVKKIMQAMGMVVVETVEKLTRAFIRMILEKLLVQITEGAKKAIRSLTNIR